MKRIEAIIRPEKMEDVKQGLIDSGHAELTLYRVQGRTAGKGITRRWRGQEYAVDLLPEAAVVLMANDREVPAIVDVIKQNAQTNCVGDGRIFVTSIEQFIPVGSGDVEDEVP